MVRRFFGLTPSDKEIYLEYIFVLMYYMGFTYNEAYRLPLWQRTWFVDRLNKEFNKANENGEPNVIWLQDILDKELGEGLTKVICPITDAFVGHHGSLGGFVRVYITGETKRERILEITENITGIEKVWTAENVAEELELPLDREGDIAIAGDKKR